MEQQDKFAKTKVQWLVTHLAKQLKFCWLRLAWAKDEQRKGKEQTWDVPQVEGNIQLCSMFR